ncbi:MAG: outer membrane beta-barrel protein [Prevotella sp.]|nr:outer membrane beta-barrel protein [Prevotella sp.]MBR6188865.1 outer membrane beta-barrel protein [Prevotella sp.]
MKHFILFVLWACSLLSASAQTLSLADALEHLNQQQDDYEISFIHNELEHLQVVAGIEGMSAPKAVKQLTKDQPVRVVTKGKQIFVQYKPKADNRYIVLTGKVKDNLTHNDLPHSNVRLLTADGVCIDSCEAISYMQYGNNPPIEYADFAFRVPARPAKYIIQATYVGFKPTEMPFELNNIYRREQRRELPPVYMKRETKILQEVVVTSSKVQFYYKGDTLVFNADAFELAEGSMLDALVRQLPGVELKEGGRIYHNGKYVDALLLNGKDFFRGDHTIMLDNLPAYTVKDIQIYDKWGDQSEFLGQHVMGDNRYVMDVKLKKEYHIGTLANAEVGGGTKERWLARLFALRFSDHSRLAAYATANNMNGDGKPGEAGSWDPQRLQDGGQLTQQQAGIDYNVDDRNSKWKVDGNVQVTHTDLNRETNTFRQNYLFTGDTYDRIHNTQRDKNLKLNTSHHYYHNFGMWNLDVRPSLNYQKFDNSTYSLASAFYQNDSLINRNLQRGLTEGHSIDGAIRLNSTLKFHHSPDWASLDAEANFSDHQEDRYHRQFIEYANQPSTAFNRYYRNHPNRSWKARGGGTYQINFTQLIRLQLNASYTHNDRRRESSLFDIDTTYALGQLPSAYEYEQYIDRRNSYTSHFTEDIYEFSPRLFFNAYTDNESYQEKWWSQLGFPVTLVRQQLNYQRGSIDTLVTRNTMPINIWDCFIQYTTINKVTGHAQKLHLQYIATSTTPDLQNLVDMRDDTDPLNIRLGNNSLHNAVNHRFSFSHQWGNANQKEVSHRYSLGYSIIQNALAMGYRYDRATGVRTWQADNVNGNWNADVNYSFNTAIGKKHPLRLNVSPSISYQHSVDLVDQERSTVNTLSLNNTLKLSYKLGQHSFSFKNTTLWQRYTSKRTDFETQQPLTLTNSLTALLKLPWKMELNTDLNLYTRTGYADSRLNTTDLVWNARLSRPFLKGRLLLMLDGFDLLGQLDNVTRIVNAQGRTETFTNVQPRYALLHVVYRFNKQPKKK